VRCGWGALLASCFCSVGCGSTAVDSEDCVQFADQHSQTEFRVRFTNARSQAGFVGMQTGCGSLEPIALQNAQAESQVLSLGDCGFGCERLQHSAAGCPALCRIPEIIQIQPGGHHDFVWSGTIYVQVAMPAACYRESGQASATCAKSMIAPPGAYQVSGTLWPVADCSGAGGPCATCTPDSDGSCTISGGHVSGQGATKSATLEVPASQSVELVFD